MRPHILSFKCGNKNCCLIQSNGSLMNLGYNYILLCVLIMNNNKIKQQPPNTARYQSHQAKCSSVLCGVKCDTPRRETVGNSWKLLKSQAKFKNLHPMKHVIPRFKILSQNEGVKLKYLSSSPNSMWRKEIQILDNLFRRYLAAVVPPALPGRAL